MWKNIEDFPNCYVNEKGEVKSVKGFILKPIYDKDGYTKVSLKHKNGKVFSKRIHILVCEAFLPNPENKPVVNHKNGVKDDNRLENLEWATISENGLHAFKYGLIEHSQNKPLHVYLRNELIGVFKNNKQAQESLKINRKTMIDYRDSGNLLYGELLLVEVDSVSVNDDLYNIEIIKKSDGSVLNSKPLRCSNRKVYKSIESSALDLGINYKTVAKYMESQKPYKGLEFVRITPYEYLKSIGFA